MLAVVDPGLSSTIQDRGRVGFGHLGVARAGAADALAYFVANALAGNRVGVAALEMTLQGATFEVESDGIIAIAGAEMGARSIADDRHLPTGEAHRLETGQRVAFGAADDGARTYVAIRGGVLVAEVLGSRSTDPVAGFGGLGGRALRAGDRLEAGADSSTEAWVTPWPGGVPSSGVGMLPGPRELAVVPGPHSGIDDGALSAQLWRVSGHGDRVGLRFDGPPIVHRDLDLPSFPLLPGAVELPPDGRPIVLLPDAPSVGGYPVPLVVAEVDLPALGQLQAGDEVRFVPIDVETARAWQRDHLARLDRTRSSR